MLVAPDVVPPDDGLEDQKRDIHHRAVAPFLEARIAVVELVCVVEQVIEGQYHTCQEERHNEIDVGVHQESIYRMPLDE